VPLSQFKLIFFYNVKRALHSTGISAKFDFFSGKIANNTDFSFDSRITTERLKFFVKSMSITRETNPVTIDKNFSLLGVQKVRTSHLLKFLHSPVL
jgi:hypothetical protein